MEKTNRLFGLDIVRCCAIVLVMINHSSTFLPAFKSKWSVAFFSGFLGVELFFCLSGFLIGTILIKVINNSNARIADILSFWTKRWFRTIPIYWVCLLLYAICYLVTKFPDFGEISLPVFLRYPFFLQNLFYYHPPFFEVSWSLCIEEWFYLIFPLILFIVLILIKRKKSAVLLTIGIVIISAFTIRLLMYHHLTHQGVLNDYSWDRGLRKMVICRLDATVYGVLLAYVSYYYKKKLTDFRKWITLTGGLLFLLGCTFFVKYGEANIFNFCSVVLTFPLVNLGFSMLLINFFDIQKGTRFRGFFNLVERISLISYSVYLLHFTIWCFFEHYFSPDYPLWGKLLLFAGFWVITYYASVCTYTFIEKPVLRYRDRLTAK
jgi:peptidoglycan/LPS O-acetylase OafA/YrhL